MPIRDMTPTGNIFPLNSFGYYYFLFPIEIPYFVSSSSLLLYSSFANGLNSFSEQALYECSPLRRLGSGITSIETPPRNDTIEHPSQTDVLRATLLSRYEGEEEEDAVSQIRQSNRKSLRNVAVFLPDIFHVRKVACLLLISYFFLSADVGPQCLR